MKRNSYRTTICDVCGKTIKYDLRMTGDVDGVSVTVCSFKCQDEYMDKFFRGEEEANGPSRD